MRNILSAVLLFGSRIDLQPREESKGRLYTSPGDTKDGAFAFPRTYPLTFREGSSINVSWSTELSSVNLYFYQRGKVANSIQIATNLAVDWFQWDVSTVETNLTDPFVFRVVNARGTVQEAATGGFWSTSYYIARDITAAAVSSSDVPTSSLSLTPTPSITPTNATATTVQHTSVEQSSSTVNPTSTKAIPTSTETSNERSPWSGRLKVITGVTTCLILVLLISVVGTVYYFKWRSRKDKCKSSTSDIPQPTTAEKFESQHPVSVEQHEVYVPPYELQSVEHCHELAADRVSPHIR